MDMVDMDTVDMDTVDMDTGPTILQMYTITIQIPNRPVKGISNQAPIMHQNSKT